LDRLRPTIPCEPDLLARVNVRLLEDHERDRFNLLLEERHYLHSSDLVGEHLRYVAELDGQWVALVAFSAASRHLKGRDKRLGWSPRQRTRRLSFVANNSRFLVLTDRQRLPNLASRVLGLCLRRLSQDWLDRWKHPILVVESFVDESQYRGTCYRACGFEPIGPTGGAIASPVTSTSRMGSRSNSTCARWFPVPLPSCVRLAYPSRWLTSRPRSPVPVPSRRRL